MEKTIQMNCSSKKNRIRANPYRMYVSEVTHIKIMKSEAQNQVRSGPKG